MNIIYMGTPEFSVAPLRALHAAGHRVVAVYTQPPRPKGRGQALQKSPVHLLAEILGIPVFHPLSFKKDPQAVADFCALVAREQVEIAVVAAYGLILPQAVLDAPAQGCLNIHASLLPRWRGASPIQHAILHKDAQSGITIMRMELGLDTGPMLMKKSIALAPDITTPILHDALSAMGADMIVDILSGPVPEGEVQDDSQSTYAGMLKKQDGLIDWTKDAVIIDAQIRALNPWPGVWCFNPAQKRIKILKSEPRDDVTDMSPGTLINASGDVACADGTILRLITIHPESAKPMDIGAAMHGGVLKPGQSLIGKMP